LRFREYTVAKGRWRMTTSSEPKRFLGLSSLELALLVVLICLIIALLGFLAVRFFSSIASGGALPTLSAEDVFEVSAVGLAKDEGYTVTSAVCEVVSSEREVVSGVDLGHIVFHAFRITKPSLGKEVVVLFASNHTASEGAGLIFTVNSEASSLFPDFPDVSRRSEHPITVDTPGAQTALLCAQKAGSPPSLELGKLDVEAWRREAIQKFGAEETYSDGSKDDYVQLALSICDLSASERENMLTNLGADYEGSLQQFIIETFCPYAK
jgi:hypothetical protein